MKNREKWQKDAYSKYWLNQVNNYGFDNYCKGLFDLIDRKKPKSIYELAIGTGWPFAIKFHENGIKVSGSDIAEILIAEINSHYPDINVNVSSYENLDTTCVEKYDVVYCFRSTWYFPDIIRALDTMFGLVKNGGSVVFDIMNKDSSYIKEITIKHRLFMINTIFKNILRKVANLFLGKNYLIQNLWNINEIPVSIHVIEDYLNKNEIAYTKYSINQIIEGEELPFIENGKQSSKIVFDCYFNK